MSKKICLLTDSLSSGGAEKMVANLSHSFVQKGYDVTIVTMLDGIGYSYKGELFNFGEIKQHNTRLKSFFKFRNFFKDKHFDYIIDHRVRTKFFKELVFSKLVFNNLKVVYCVHHYKLELYFPSIKFPNLNKLCLANKKEIVVVSKEIQKVLKQDLSYTSKVIYNYALHKNLKSTADGLQYIVAVGRLEKIKQFDVLINCYNNSKLPEKNIKLLIFGDGAEKKNLNRLIQDLDLKHLVELKGFKNNIDAYVHEAKAMVLSSESEGFPMVLIEALSLKTPVISFDCKSGPNEIIKNNINGLLVENQNAEHLTSAINKLILDTEFYNSIINNLNQETNPFSEAVIINQWIQLLEGLN